MHELTLFPRVRYIGGVDGRGLDLWVGRTTRFIKLSLGMKGVLNLERVVAYGCKPGSDTVENLTLFKPATQSSVLKDDEALYGAHRGTNGMANGYDYFSTKEEARPWWCVDLGDVCHINTLHLANILFAGPHQLDMLQIEFSADGEQWELFYNRAAPEVYVPLTGQLLKTLRQAGELPAATVVQRSAQAEILSIADSLELLSRQTSRPSPAMSGALGARLVALVECFLPKTLELRSPLFIDLQPLGEIRRVRVTGSSLDRSPPTLTAAHLSPGAAPLSAAAVELEVSAALAGLTVAPGGEAWRCNSLRVEVELATGETEVVYDRGRVVRLCGQLAWVAYAMGDNSARCVALQALPGLMLREEKGLREAYLWARARLHHQPQEFRQELFQRLTDATEFDAAGTRLAFGRHAFATPHRYRNKAAYAMAIREVLTWLDKQGMRTMVLYGTLLGAVREGTLLDHDDDVDAGYLCTSCTAAEFKAEKARVVALLKAGGWLISDDTSENPHATFTVLVPWADGDVYPVEFFPLGYTPGAETCTAYMHCMNIVEIPGDLIGQANTTVRVDGIELPAPADPEGFLACRYGADWETPNPLFEI